MNKQYYVLMVLWFTACGGASTAPPYASGTIAVVAPGAVRVGDAFDRRMNRIDTARPLLRVASRDQESRRIEERDRRIEDGHELGFSLRLWGIADGSINAGGRHLNRVYEILKVEETERADPTSWQDLESRACYVVTAVDYGRVLQLRDTRDVSEAQAAIVLSHEDVHAALQGRGTNASSDRELVVQGLRLRGGETFSANPNATAGLAASFEPDSSPAVPVVAHIRRLERCTSPESTLENRVNLSLRSVRVPPLQPNGDSWDIGGNDPDVVVRMTWANSTTGNHAGQEDQTRIDFEDPIELQNVRMNSAQPLVVEVFDADVAFHDRIARIELPYIDISRCPMASNGSYRCSVPIGQTTITMDIAFLDD